MVSTGQIRLLTALADHEVTEYSPSLAENSGDIRYEDAERILEGEDKSPYEALEELAERGILAREFQGKEYVCPNCTASGLRFSTACPECGSLHTIESEMLVHLECGHTDQAEAFYPEGEEGKISCPTCTATVDSEDELERRLLHWCQECNSTTDAPDHALRCLACEQVFAPFEGIERVLYRYRFEKRGEAWLEKQLTARDSLAESLSQRGFDVTIDTCVGSEKREYSVDVVGEDELLGDCIVGAVHDQPMVEDLDRLLSVARAADASPVLVTTSGMLHANVATMVEKQGIRVLSPKGSELVSAYEVVGQYEPPTVFQRIASSVTERLQ